jgi:hypothetical protein
MTYYIGNRDYKKQRKSRFILRWAKKVRAINESGGKCVNCGEDRPWVLQFHHTNPSDKEISVHKLSACAWSRIEKEIKKCILVCESCHREIHAAINPKIRSIKNKVIALSFKQQFSCEKCGYNKCNKSLDFHHAGDKKQELADIVIRSKWRNVQDIEDDIIIELNKCSVLCANCHRTEHTNVEEFLFFEQDIIAKSKLFKVVKNVDREKLFQLHKEGLNQHQISKQLECATSTVCGILKEAGLQANPYKTKETKIDAALVLRLKLEGYKEKEICCIAHCSRGGLYYILHK